MDRHRLVVPQPLLATDNVTRIQVSTINKSQQLTPEHKPVKPLQPHTACVYTIIAITASIRRDASSAALHLEECGHPVARLSRQSHVLSH